MNRYRIVTGILPELFGLKIGYLVQRKSGKGWETVGEAWSLWGARLSVRFSLADEHRAERLKKLSGRVIEES